MKRYLYNLATDRYRGFFSGMVKVLLLALSVVYGFVIRFLIAFYRLRPYNPGCKVISVGNITLGGTGKTPLVEYIASLLRKRGHKVGILTRGYGRKFKSDEEMGDEVKMLSENLGDIPVIVSSDRVKGAKKAIREHAVDTVILDDGFQQWRIKKDIEIVVIDAANPFGNKHLLPRGILREPLSSLRRADILVLTKTNLVRGTARLRNYLQRVNHSALIVESIHAAITFYALGKRADTFPVRDLEARKVALVSGIGDPASFEGLIKRFGIGIELSLRFSDHYHYAKKDFADIAAQCRAKYIDTVITTEKDAARLNLDLVKESGLRIVVFKIQLEFTENEEGFIRRLSSLYSP